MKSICLYFTVHQPIRLRKIRFFDIGNTDYCYDDHQNESILQKVTQNCYLPANKLLIQLINKHQGRFKVALSISGTAIDQFKIYAPQVIDSFKELAATGCVEFVAETYSHSLAAIKDTAEFKKQVKLNADAIESLFGERPTVFANTELIYSDEIGELVAEMGYRAILTEDPHHILKWRSPNYLYSNAINPSLAVLLNNDMLSNDIAYRFSDKNWDGWPLTAPKYVSWLNKFPEKEKIVNLFMNYETFGERQKSENGIFDFLNTLPSAVLRKSEFKFHTPSEVVANHQPISKLDVPKPFTCANGGKDLSTWLQNELQQEAFENLYELSESIEHCHDEQLLKDWQYLQTSDHFCYMCTKHHFNNVVHASCSPYDSPYEAFLNYMNVLNDFTIRLNRILNPKINLNKKEKAVV